MVGRNVYCGVENGIREKLTTNPVYLICAPTPHARVLTFELRADAVEILFQPLVLGDEHRDTVLHRPSKALGGVYTALVQDTMHRNEHKAQITKGGRGGERIMAIKLIRKIRTTKGRGGVQYASTPVSYALTVSTWTTQPLEDGCLFLKEATSDGLSLLPTLPEVAQTSKNGGGGEVIVGVVDVYGM